MKVLADVIREKHERIQKLREEIASLEEELSQASDALASVGGRRRRRDKPSSTKKGPRTRPIRGTSAVGYALKILRHHRRPMQTDELLEHIRTVYGADVSKATLVSGLSRYVNASDTFTRPEESVYGLVDYDAESEEIAD